MRTKYRVVVIDCQTALVEGGFPDGEAIHLTATDYATGKVLLNEHILPTRHVIDWKTHIHGISEADVRRGNALGNTIVGPEAARLELWKFIDDQTVLVGHKMWRNLKLLRMFHSRIVDTAILAKEWSTYKNNINLYTLCLNTIKFETRNNDGHMQDSLENAMAIREVLIQCLGDPDILLGYKASCQERYKAARDEKKEKRRQAKEARQLKLANEKMAEADTDVEESKM